MARMAACNEMACMHRRYRPAPAGYATVLRQIWGLRKRTQRVVQVLQQAGAETERRY